MNLLREIMDEIKPQIMTKIEADMKREIVDQMRVMLEEPSLMQLTKDVEAKVGDKVREEIVDRIERQVNVDDLVDDFIDNAEVESMAARRVRDCIVLEDLIKDEISDSDIENNMPDITDMVQSALVELIDQEMSVEKVQAAMRPILRKLVTKELGLNEGAESVVC